MDVRDELSLNGKRYYRRLMGMARKLVASNGGWRADYEDMVQEALARLLERSESTEIYGDDLFGLLAQIMYRKYLDEKDLGRRNGRCFGIYRGDEPFQIDGVSEGYFANVPANQELRCFVGEVGKAIDALPPKQKEAVLARAVTDSIADAAILLGVNPNSVKTNYTRAMEALEPLLGRPRHHKNTANGYRGVTKHGRKWRAAMSVCGKSFKIGSFATPEEAALAYDAYALEVRGPEAELNFPIPAP